MKEVNFFNSNIKFTYQYDNEKISYLDMEFDIAESKLIISYL